MACLKLSNRHQARAYFEQLGWRNLKFFNLAYGIFPNLHVSQYDYFLSFREVSNYVEMYRDVFEDRALRFGIWSGSDANSFCS
jgi:hypothetical protein